MRFSALFLFLILLSPLSLQAQTIKDLNKAAKGNSSRPGSSGQSYRGSDDAFAAWMMLRSLIWIGQGMGHLSREEVRLAKRNKEENHLFSLDVKPQAGYGLTGFVRLQPQIRANVGWFSLDLKQSILQDASSEFKTLGFMFWMNFWNKGRFRFRGGVGSLGLNTTGESFFQYALGAEFIPSPKIRFELEAGMSESLLGTALQPLREIQFRVYHPFWTKGFLQASVFGGAGSQQYFESLDFSTLDAGLNFRISASRYEAARQVLPAK
jgi:hypothetical protein